ncbi:MAG: transketolase [Thermodesulfobacteriota bacterium]|nr:transketolase [Thermodesulfobacteriota bacterium]
MIKKLTPELKKEIAEKAAQSRGDIIAMTHLAGSGHPGGSLSSIDIYTLLYHIIDMEKDKVIASHGHTSPAVYSALARSGMFDPLDVIKGFRRIGSIFEGHVEPSVPGVPWGTGNLGQGLSAACGYAVANRVKGESMDCFVVMGDGEQQKGQISEARRFIKKYALNNITVIIDNNRLQISGDREKVMPQDLKKEYESAGIKVLEINGHDLDETYKALSLAVTDTNNAYAIIANTVMGKGIGLMENKAGFHGKALNNDEMTQALKDVSIEWPLEELRAMRSKDLDEKAIPQTAWTFPAMNLSKAHLYTKDTLTDNRSAFGTALLETAQANKDAGFAVFDCDLAGSVKTAGFSKAFPENFFQAGIAEHNTVAMAGVASTQGIISVFADFGMFGIDETYNQQRLNAINHASLKLFCTHIGIDVGEDGKTHQCIDYVGLMQNLEGFRVVIPIDPNETDLATRWALAEKGNILVGMGRSKLAIITDENNVEFFKDKEFSYGKAHHLKKGSRGTIFALGGMSSQALGAWALMKEKGIDIEVVGVSCPLALKKEEIAEAAAKGPVFVVEDHLEQSGLASQIAYTASTNAIGIKLVPMGIHGFPASGPSKDCLKIFGLDPEGIASRIEEILGETA